MFYRRIAFFLAMILPGVAVAEPKVVVSIKPIASLVGGVMAGVGTPTVLVGGGQSLHTFSLKPSDARALNDADVVFWVGEGLEAFLEKPIDALSDKAMVVELAEAPGLVVLNGREGGVWEKHADDEHDEHDHGNHAHNSAHNFDGHLWLDPINAKAIVTAAQNALSKADPAHAANYSTNANALLTKLDALDAELRQAFAPIKARPFVVFHDGYQYLEKRYGLNAVGSLTVSPDRTPGAKRVSEIKDKITSLNAACVFAEPQFEPKLIATLIDGTNAKTGTLDPEASTLPAGPDLYFNLMRGLAANLKSC
ncbi:MAG: zinc ABC transporter substrate-binding protein, partial [Rhodospirillaceae bacterium]|nr:zinc ABC transporter substrate-binding protein [Rhodospirillaceae bacterium]